ncbi:MAG: ABC transporter substrate-binding protein [Solirubrobacterales bacterium]|nr:ABC transporter substrate-binding protein [Solirubrobacterales bacterium]
MDGEDAALTYVLSAQSAGLRVVAVQAFPRQAADYTGLARSVAGSGADCVLVSALDEASAVRLTQAVAHALPKATIFATAGLADDAYLNPNLGGLPTSLDSRLIVVSPSLPASAYPPAGRLVLAEYSRRFGVAPPAGIFGYQAMELMLSAIRRATDGGRRPADRSKVRAELFSGRWTKGALGRLRINQAGDPSLHAFAIYRVVDGRLTLLQEVG